MNLSQAYAKVKPYLVTATLNNQTYYLGLYRTLGRAKKSARTHNFTQNLEEQIAKDVVPVFVQDKSSKSGSWYEAPVKTKIGKVTYVISQETIR